MSPLLGNLTATEFLHTNVFFFLEYLISDFDIMIYVHLLIWVGFGLIGYVPNTLYIRYLYRCDEIENKTNFCRTII
jgi:hypothetical protein